MRRDAQERRIRFVFARPGQGLTRIDGGSRKTKSTRSRSRNGIRISVEASIATESANDRMFSPRNVRIMTSWIRSRAVASSLQSP